MKASALTLLDWSASFLLGKLGLLHHVLNSDRWLRQSGLQDCLCSAQAVRVCRNAEEHF